MGEWQPIGAVAARVVDQLKRRRRCWPWRHVWEVHHTEERKGRKGSTNLKTWWRCSVCRAWISTYFCVLLLVWSTAALAKEADCHEIDAAYDTWALVYEHRTPAGPVLGYPRPQLCYRDLRDCNKAKLATNAVFSFLNVPWAADCPPVPASLPPRKPIHRRARSGE